MYLKLTRLQTLVLAPSLLSLFISTAAFADIPGRHPGYLHALTDLREARALIMRPDAPNVENDESRAVNEINACIRDLIKASINDGKDPYDKPLSDVGPDFKGRLHKSLDLMRKARHDMDKEEDDPANQGLQARANEHVDRAIHHVERAIGDKARDGE